MTFPISIIPYANMEPYRLLGPPAGCHFVSDTPRQSTQALLDGRILAAPIPVGDLGRVENLIQPVGAFGIAAAGAVKSVLLFSKHPFLELAAPAKIHLTDQSSSSVRLLFLLLGQQFGFDRLPFVTDRVEDAQAQLLIGDQALSRLHQQTDRCVTDLAQEWVQRQGLPFVFARWVVRKDAPTACQKALAAWLAEFRRRETNLVQQSITTQARRLNLPEEIIRDYFSSLRRVLGSAEVQGQERFLSLLRKHQRTPLFQNPKAEP